MSKNQSFFSDIQSTHNEVSLVVARLLIGWIFFRAGAGKLFGWTTYGGWQVTKSYFMQMGLPFPDVMLLIVGCLELICGIALILGLWARLAAIPLAVIMFVGILTVHREAGYYFPLLIYAICLITIQFGAGRFSLDSLMSNK